MRAASLPGGVGPGGTSTGGGSDGTAGVGAWASPARGMATQMVMNAAAPHGPNNRWIMTNPPRVMQPQSSPMKRIGPPGGGTRSAGRGDDGFLGGNHGAGGGTGGACPAGAAGMAAPVGAAGATGMILRTAPIRPSSVW